MLKGSISVNYNEENIFAQLCKRLISQHNKGSTIRRVTLPSSSSVTILLYTNVDLKLRNKSHGQMHYKIGVPCVFNGHKINTLLYTTCINNQHDNLFHLLNKSADLARVSRQCSYTI